MPFPVFIIDVLGPFVTLLAHVIVIVLAFLSNIVSALLPIFLGWFALFLSLGLALLPIFLGWFALFLSLGLQLLSALLTLGLRIRTICLSLAETLGKRVNRVLYGCSVFRRERPTAQSP